MRLGATAAKLVQYETRLRALGEPRVATITLPDFDIIYASLPTLTARDLAASSDEDWMPSFLAQPRKLHLLLRGSRQFTLPFGTLGETARHLARLDERLESTYGEIRELIPRMLESGRRRRPFNPVVETYGKGLGPKLAKMIEALEATQRDTSYLEDTLHHKNHVQIDELLGGASSAMDEALDWSLRQLGRIRPWPDRSINNFNDAVNLACCAGIAYRYSHTSNEARPPLPMLITDTQKVRRVSDIPEQITGRIERRGTWVADNNRWASDGLFFVMETVLSRHFEGHEKLVLNWLTRFQHRTQRVQQCWQNLTQAIERYPDLAAAEPQKVGTDELPNAEFADFIEAAKNCLDPVSRIIEAESSTETTLQRMRVDQLLSPGTMRLLHADLRGRYQGELTRLKDRLDNTPSASAAIELVESDPRFREVVTETNTPSPMLGSQESGEGPDDALNGSVRICVRVAGTERTVLALDYYPSTTTEDARAFYIWTHALDISDIVRTGLRGLEDIVASADQADADDRSSQAAFLYGQLGQCATVPLDERQIMATALQGETSYIRMLCGGIAVYADADLEDVEVPELQYAVGVPAHLLTESRTTLAVARLASTTMGIKLDERLVVELLEGAISRVAT